MADVIPPADAPAITGMRTSWVGPSQPGDALAFSYASSASNTKSTTPAV